MSIYTYTFSWEGITIDIKHDDNYLNMNSDSYHVEHIEIYSENKRQLPITETGYRSHFITHSDEISQYGTALNFVRIWLNHEAKSKSWKAHINASKQLTLF